MKKLFSENKSNPWFWLFVGVAAILFFAMPLMSLDAGNSGDEDRYQIPQGRFIIDYYQTDGQDTTCLQDFVNFSGKDVSWNLKYYGCSFDVVTEWINRTFGFSDIARTRHICNALLGWLVVFFGALIARRMGGWRAGLLALLLLFFSPRLLGHSFNNPKDIPLAAGIIMSLYYIMMFFRQLTPSLQQQSSAKGKKIQFKAIFPQQAFPDKTTLILSIALIVVSLPLLFKTAGVALTLLIVALFVVALFIKDTPHLNPLTLLMLALSLALAVSNRIGGLIIVGYMGLWGLLWFIRYGRHVGGATVAKAVVTAAAVCLTGFFAGLILWPYAMQNPIHNAIESFHQMSQFSAELRQLFEGEMMMSSQLPWYYTPKFMLMSIPLVVMAGWLIYPFFGAFGRDRRIDSIMIYFCFIFPVFWLVYTHANVYGGWRHSLFAYPPMAVAAALGFDAFAAWIGARTRRRWVEAVAFALPLLLMIRPAVHTFRNHPYQYVYFNGLSGGIEKAFGQFELDYYYHSMRGAVEWVMDNAEPKADGSKTLIGSWHIESTDYFLRKDTASFATRFARWGQRYEFDWDYLVFPVTGISGEYLRGPGFPPADCVHTIDVDNVPIAVILKRQTKDDLYAVQQLKAGNVDSAVTLFNNVLAVNPTNETALANLASISMQRGANDDAISLCDRLLTVDPSNPQASQIKVYALLNSGRSDEAAAMLDALKSKAQFSFPFTITAQLYAQQGNVNAALAELNSMLDQGLMDQDAFNLYVQIRMSQGADQNSAAYGFYTAYANGLEKTGDVVAADNLRRQLRGY